jgi:hypothetical protein
LIEQGVVALEAELRAEDGAAAGSIDEEFAAKKRRDAILDYSHSSRRAVGSKFNPIDAGAFDDARALAGGVF